LLIVPDVVEDLIVDVIRRRHPEHLAKLERQRGKAAETYERYATVSHMASEAADARLSGDTLPACLLGFIGTAATPIQTENDRLNVALQLAMQVTVLGQRRRDTLRRRDVMAWTTIECVLQRVPRNGPVASIRLTDYEPVEERDEQRILAEARVIFEVTVADMVTVIGGLPADDTPWPAGGPNSGPPDGEPYTPPLGPPEATDVTFAVEKHPIVD
jgi:hypothetical protein